MSNDIDICGAKKHAVIHFVLGTAVIWLALCPKILLWTFGELTALEQSMVLRYLWSRFRLCLCFVLCFETIDI
jgi:hypothetical protein